jgi:hypothetical protein
MLERRYLAVSSAIARNGGQADPRWPCWFYELALEVVSARATEHGAATVRRIKAEIAKRKKK